MKCEGNVKGVRLARLATRELNRGPYSRAGRAKEESLMANDLENRRMDELLNRGYA